MDARPPALDVGALVTGAEAMGVALSASAIAAFERYAAALVAWNARLNLTRVADPEGIARRHVLDSLAVLAALPTVDDRVGAIPPGGASAGPSRCIDVGAGAGLPGIPLKIVRPAWSLALVESVGKKAAFLAHAVEVVALDRTVVLAIRAEDAGRDPAHRETYDLAVARAVADLPVLVEYLLPLLAIGGRMVVHKGEHAPAEAARAAGAIETLGGRLFDVRPYTVPTLPGSRFLVIADKVSPTPDTYPRPPGRPSKRPLA